MVCKCQKKPVIRCISGLLKVGITQSLEWSPVLLLCQISLLFKERFWPFKPVSLCLTSPPCTSLLCKRLIKLCQRWRNTDYIRTRQGKMRVIEFIMKLDFTIERILNIFTPTKDVFTVCRQNVWQTIFLCFSTGTRLWLKCLWVKRYYISTPHCLALTHHLHGGQWCFFCFFGIGTVNLQVLQCPLFSSSFIRFKLSSALLEEFPLPKSLSYIADGY